MSKLNIFVRKGSRKKDIENYLIVPEVDPLVESLTSKIVSSQIPSLKKKKMLVNLHICKHKLCAMVYHKERIRLLEKKYKKVLKSSIHQMKSPEGIMHK